MIVYRIVLIFFALLLLIAVGAVLYSFGENERLKRQLEAARRGKARYAEIAEAYAQIIDDNALCYSERLLEKDKQLEYYRGNYEYSRYFADELSNIIGLQVEKGA